MYTYLIEHGSSKKTVEMVFDKKFEAIKGDFDDIIAAYKNMSKVIGELKTNKFIIDKNSHDKKIIETIKKKIAYPILLLLVLYVLLLIFHIAIIPNLESVLLTLDSDGSNLLLFKLLIMVLLIIYMIATFLLIYINHKYKDDVYAFYMNLYELNVKNLLVDHSSLEFAKYFLILYQLGLSTKDCFQLLAGLDQKKILVAISEKANTVFKHGHDIQSVIEDLAYDAKLKKFFLIGIESGTIIAMLNKYIDISTINFFKKLDHLMKTTEVIVYLVISVFIIMLYRILLLPMQNLQL